ncbi:glycosyltransferase family 4 protein [Nostoc sp. NIES-2111]
MIYIVNRFGFPDVSATAQLASDLAKGFIEKGLDCTIVCGPSSGVSGTESSCDGVSMRTIHMLGLASRSGSIVRRMWDALLFSGSLLAFCLVVAQKRDVIIVMTDPPFNMFPVLVCRWVRRYFVINWLQDIYPEVAVELGAITRSRLSRVLTFFRDFSLKRADCNVVIGDLMRDYVQSRGVDPLKIALVPNWVPGDAVEAFRNVDNGLRAALGLTDRFVVGYSGNLGMAHDFETMLNAAEKLGTNSNIRFVVFGGGVNYRRMKAGVAAKSLEKMFIFQPHQPLSKLSESLGSIDVHWLSLLPAVEGYIVPSKIYGILASGRPVVFIGSPDGEVARLVCTNGLGACIRVGDYESLVRFLEWILSEPEQLDSCGRRGRELYISTYSRVSAISRFTDIVAKVAGPTVRLVSH